MSEQDWRTRINGVLTEMGSLATTSLSTRGHELLTKLSGDCGSLPKYGTDWQDALKAALAVFKSVEFGHSRAVVVTDQVLNRLAPLDDASREMLYAALFNDPPKEYEERAWGQLLLFGLSQGIVVSDWFALCESDRWQKMRCLAPILALDILVFARQFAKAQATIVWAVKGTCLGVGLSKLKAELEKWKEWVKDDPQAPQFFALLKKAYKL